MGDAFILRAIERHVGAFDPQNVFSTRMAPSAAEKQRMKAADTVIIAGANQLNDQYTIWPGLTAEGLRAADWVFVPFGVGVHGAPQRNARMSDATKEVLRAMHERIEYSSWRCPRTVAYLREHLPELSDRFLMTGCPVLYDRPLLESARFHEGEAQVAVTVTDRGDFWEREETTLVTVAKLFPRSRRYMVLHENFRPPSFWEPLRNRLPYAGALSFSRRSRLRWLATQLGYEVVIPDSPDALLRFYDGLDMHFGSRLHAHLRFLSQNKRSFLTHVDERATGMSEFLGFPICDPARFGEHLSFDFEALRRRAQDAYVDMRRFLDSLSRRGRC
ncbi:hypothetical protein [Caldimonas thermodepolymerans]|uniref:hypothetical protein n=1 Tax=Caldimonas thermodepolymerans TaxID=215580 RepID=UPI002236B9A3|nr:hypothetical protein [Caldimonas thermodepolymerans]UZG45397.1 hypothetical protein ONZ46_05435 [Caldimonas thermodepolymerans]